MVIIVFGLPGSGKSYFASRLAAATGAAYINSDQLRKQIIAQPTYTQQEKNTVYQNMLQQTNVLLQQNKWVVLDATFYTSSLRQRFIHGCSQSTVLFIEVVADEKTALERVSKHRAYSDADAAVYTKIKQQWQPLEAQHLVLQSGANNIQDMLAQATKYINTHDGSANTNTCTTGPY
jgi:predicted kinase